ncbi:SAM-dependent methyltransferase [Minicystis rosea]|nr:SAM-dependent methyltransferase [Minicystis rosea]
MHAAEAERLRAFIRSNTAVVAPPLLPEIRLHLATEVTPLWQATEQTLSLHGIEPPFWAFAWAGGQALARHLLDVPDLVRGRRVLDFASGSGLCAVAAALAGAANVIAVERDPLAAIAIALNADLSGVTIDARLEDVLDTTPAWLAGCDVVIAGDVCYDRAMASRVQTFLRARAQAGALVLIGDPGRAYLDDGDLEQITRYRVPTIDDVEGQAEKTGVVYRVRARAAGT